MCVCFMFQREVKRLTDELQKKEEGESRASKIVNILEVKVIQRHI